MSNLKISLEAARVNAKLTQREAAEGVGVTVQTLINWEKGRTSPMIDKAIALCNLYGIDLDNLIFYTPQSI